MNNLKTYIQRYDKIIKNLGYTGASAEILRQLLANASYINEVEHASYMVESSLEKATLLNSKIQHCVDLMYSVFRGSCPRIIFKIKPNKYTTLRPYDKLISSNNFDVIYLDYYKSSDEVDGSSSKSTKSMLQRNTLIHSMPTTTTRLKENNLSIIDTTGDEEDSSEDSTKPIISLDQKLENGEATGSWVSSTITLRPYLDDSDICIIRGFIVPKKIGEEGKYVVNKTINKFNTLFVECLADNLSDDVYIEIDNKIVTRTRQFSDHIVNKAIFDLTLPSFGSRLYFGNIYREGLTRDSSISGLQENAKVIAQYYPFSTLDQYNRSELEKLRVPGAELVEFSSNGFTRVESVTQTFPGICLIESVPRDDMYSIHYKANRDRFVNSILRSNSDIGTVLEETYPTIVKSGGTTFRFGIDGVTIFYIPKEEGTVLSRSQIDSFRTSKQAYYITDGTVNVQKGTRYYLNFDIELYTYADFEEGVDLNEKINKEIITPEYSRVFGVDLVNTKSLEALISKISQVRSVKKINYYITDTNGEHIGLDVIANSNIPYYFDTRYKIITEEI